MSCRQSACVTGTGDQPAIARSAAQNSALQNRPEQSSHSRVVTKHRSRLRQAQNFNRSQFTRAGSHVLTIRKLKFALSPESIPVHVAIRECTQAQHVAFRTSLRTWQASRTDRFILSFLSRLPLLHQPNFACAHVIQLAMHAGP